MKNSKEDRVMRLFLKYWVIINTTIFLLDTQLWDVMTKSDILFDKRRCIIFHQ